MDFFLMISGCVGIFFLITQVLQNLDNLPVLYKAIFIACWKKLTLPSSYFHLLHLDLLQYCCMQKLHFAIDRYLISIIAFFVFTKTFYIFIISVNFSYFQCVISSFYKFIISELCSQCFQHISKVHSVNKQQTLMDAADSRNQWLKMTVLLVY